MTPGPSFKETPDGAIGSTTVQPPNHIQNVDEWHSHCRKIRARAADLIEGRISVIEASRALTRLAHWAGLRNDDDLLTFVGIDTETAPLPVGDVRRLWAEEALMREDPKIRDAEERYRAAAIEAAARLIERFAWSLEARAKRRTRDVG